MISLSEITLIESLKKELDGHRLKNKTKYDYYYNKTNLQSLGISVPKDHEKKIKTSCSFPSIVVNSLDERIRFQGFFSDQIDGIEEIFLENNLESESPMAHVDMLIAGTAYNIIGKGAEGEPDILITPESPNNMVGRRNLRTRKLDSALHLIYAEEEEDDTLGTLFLPYATIPFGLTKDGRFLLDGEIDYHELGVVPVTQFVNRPTTSNRKGQSEIDRTVINLTNDAYRTAANLAFTQEYYGNPQKWAVNVNRDEFADGRNPFSARADAMIILGKGDNGSDMADGPGGSQPVLGQFQTGNPTAFIEILNYLSTAVAAHSSIPVNQFGIFTGNPPSADAIRAQEISHTLKVERRISSVKDTWNESGEIGVLIRDGKRPERGAIQSIFAEASTPTRAAAADEVTKLVQIGTLSPTSEVVYSRINLTAQERAMMKMEAKKQESINLIERLAQARGPLPKDTDTNTPEA